MSTSIYKPVSLEVGNILKDMQTGKIGLPDLQRPFVWGNDKVRDLLDSMLNGFPIGYIMLWESPIDEPGKKSAIGTNQKTYDVPKELVIDGRQRLTALIAAFYGIPVKDKSYKNREIRIAYNPVTRVFKNADASTDRDPGYVSNVAEVFESKRNDRISTLRRGFVSALNESN